MTAGIPDVTASYDDGYFDKDEQGWCSHNVAITQDGVHVRVHRWGDDNGLRPHEDHLEGDIVAVEGTLVRFDGTLAPFVFDLATRRLRVR
jgi:hypothetical protein